MGLYLLMNQEHFKKIRSNLSKIFYLWLLEFGFVGR